MKKLLLLLAAACVLVGCASKPVVEENPSKAPVLTVKIPELFSPNPDIVDDKIKINIAVKHHAPIKDWNIEIQPIMRQTSGQTTQRQTTQAAQGTAEQGEARQRQRQPFFAQDGKGNPPAVWEWNGKSSRQSAEMVQSATDYRFTLKVNDINENSAEYEGVIAVDVLVRREGEHLRIIVPSIVFPANLADLSKVTNEDDVRSNRRVLRLIANALNKYPDYKVTVEGHANPTTPVGAQRNKELPELRRISNDRASAVIDYLAANHGIPKQRLHSIGIGGDRTVAQYDDQDENWKNRRVEFILVK